MATVREARTWQRMALIRVSSLIPVVRELDRRGVPADLLLSRHLMSRGQLDNPYHYSCVFCFRYERCAAA